MRYELKAIGLWAFIKISFFLNLVLGFLIGLLYALFLGVIMTALTHIPGMESYPFDPGDFSVGFMVLLLPFLFAILGAFFNTIFGTILVAVYNAIARLLGGLEFDLTSVASGLMSAPPAEAAPSGGIPPPPPVSARPWSPPPVNSSHSGGSAPTGSGRPSAWPRPDQPPDATAG